MSFNGRRAIPPPVNEPVNSYAPGTPARAELKARLSSMAGERVDIPLFIGGREVRTGHTDRAAMPHLHGHVLGDFHTASPEHVDQAIAASLEARHEWASWPWEERAAVFLKAADLAATTWRSTLNAATMLGQSKTAFQAEIDSACEVIDFWRYNPWYAQQIFEAPEHDYPKRILYRANADGSRTARIDGGAQDDGGQEWRFLRVACPGAGR